MFRNIEIHEFALLWINKFKDETLTGNDLAGDVSFADACFSFGFEINKYDTFCELYSLNILNNYCELQKIIDEIDDVDLLGSLIFSNWRYYNHWAYDCEEITKPEVRSWFIIALKRLSELTSTSETSRVFSKCSIKSIKLMSNCLSFGPQPSPNENIVQHLCLNNEGNVTVVSYNYGDGINYLKNKTDNTIIDKESSEDILNLIQKFFSKECITWKVTDVGSWKLKITNEQDEIFVFTGDLCSIDQRLAHISSVIRTKLNMPKLFVFDGDSSEDRIDRLMIEYQRITKSSNAVKDNTIEYSETITLDRFTEKLTYTKQMDLNHYSLNEYCLKHDVSNLLDRHSSSDLSTNAKETTKNVISNHFENMNYKITIDYLFSGQVSVSGSFDKDGLPQDFPEFAEDIKELINSYEQNEILSPFLYERIRRKKGELIFCSVTFNESSKSYYYLTKDDTLKVGDTVCVPVGDDGNKALGEIVKIEYFTKKNAPYPLDNIKMIYPMDNYDEDDIEDSFDNLVLYDENVANKHVSLQAELSKGCLLIWGQDIGEDVENYFGKDGYEYFYAFDQENTMLLISLLKQENKDIKKALVKKFGGLGGCLDLRDFCKDNNIKYEFHTY